MAELVVVAALVVSVVPSSQRLEMGDYEIFPFSAEYAINEDGYTLKSKNPEVTCYSSAS